RPKEAAPSCRGLLAEIGFEDFRVGANLVGSSFGNGGAEVEDFQTLAKLHDEPHRMLDEKDRGPEFLAHPAKKVHEPVDFSDVEPNGLERARDAKPHDLMRRHPHEVGPAKKHRALARAVHAGDEVEERRLAGAVRADDADKLARYDLDLKIGNRAESAETVRK